jgi:hypothetical protein
MLNIFPVRGLHRRIKGMSWMRADRGENRWFGIFQASVELDKKSLLFLSLSGSKHTVQGIYRRVEVVPNMVMHQLKSIRDLFSK